ncbi:UDP-glucuronosyltransferase 2B31 [Marmota monax]|uniref:UDP-glucuronosyltransferase 2B31 n=1 Tax=Marmota monax TaxID=9995 RepID=UPI001EAFD280|nr:UDP-glucuronosyltransferase 2B31 [Marmota monax]
MSVNRNLVLLLIQLMWYFSSGSCGKVLVWPTEYSHWINIKTILDELLQRGHEVTVLTSTASILINPNTTSSINFEIYPASSSKQEMEERIIKWIHEWIYDTPKDDFWQFFSLVQKNFKKYSDTIEQLCRNVVLNKKLMVKLHESKFDVVLSDAIGPCGELLAELLKVPFVYTLRFTPGYTYEKYSGGLTFPPSYVPIVMSELSDQMTFMDRLKNIMYMLYFDFWFQTFDVKKWNQFYSEVLGRPTTIYETMGKADFWLIRTYWDLEFPRPLLPNFDFVGGLHCKPAKPLPKEMEEFLQSSGENGIVVFSLGSMVSNIPEERANIIAFALAQIPQKVIWRYQGKKPDKLGPNTRIYNWIPQNDLLGHPKTKAFITHGGANGVYEGIYHGIPMVGIPLFADQADNIAHVKAKGAAIRLEYRTLTSADLLKALRMVINDPLYKENAMKLSRIQHDQPVKPLDRAVFWIEFVMRHKGAKHLRVAAHDLSWFQYYSLDVLGFLLACVATVMFIITKCCLFCFQMFSKTGKKKKRE